MTTKNNAIAFNSLKIDKQTFGPHAGKLTCNVRCTSYNTQLDVRIPDEVIVEMMKLIAPVVASQVQIALTDVARDHELLMLAGTETVEADANA